MALDNPRRTESFALPDPNLYAARALRQALADAGISVAGTTRSTTDSTLYAGLRAHRAAGRSLFPSVAGLDLSDPQHQSELVRGNVAEAARAGSSAGAVHGRKASTWSGAF